MIIFHNPGLIEANAFRLMGASVKAEGAFGRFGTGLKYAIATILRNEGIVTVHSGDELISFELETTVLKGRCFSEVVMVEDRGDFPPERTPLGFTVDLGKDWEPWMAVRELGCNARDEGGDITLWTDPEWAPSGDGTEIVVDWPKVEAEWEEVLKQTFVSGELLHEEHGVRVYAEPSAYLYHRGVRVWKLPKPSTYTYDIISDVDLTEDRTVKYSFCVVANVRNMFLRTARRDLIDRVVRARDSWEADFDWTGTQWEPMPPEQTWLEVVSEIRSRNEHALSKSAAQVYLSHSAFKKTTSYYGGTYTDPEGPFAEAAESLKAIGLDIEKTNVFIVDELPGDQNTVVRDGSIFAKRAFVEDSKTRDAADELLRRYLELNSGGSHDKLLNLVVPMLLRHCELD